jgi:hypothetical protein
MRARDSLAVSHWSVDDLVTANPMIGTFRASARDPKLSRAEACGNRSWRCSTRQYPTLRLILACGRILWWSGEPAKPH